MPEEPSPEDGQQLRNTLYRKVTKGKRRLTPGRMFVYRVAVTITWRLVHFFWHSCRIQPIVGLEQARSVVRDSRAVIPVYWHQHMLFGVRALLDLKPAGLRIGFLISPSVDGTAPAMLARRVGAEVIRGSSTHTGARALRDYYEAIAKQGLSPAITPDGPKGPLHGFKPGAILLAQMTGKPILPISVAASRTWTLRTWDRFELPLPFSRVAIAIGEPVRVGRGLDAAGLERLQAEMARALLALGEQARASLR
jgi:lysophospholipid acyltransferase (LPLAT)-like uncharacterized protein